MSRSETENSRAQELGFGIHHDTSYPRAFKLNTQSHNHSLQSRKVKEQSRLDNHEYYNQAGKQFRHSEMEKYGAQELGFGNNYSTSCSRAFKHNTKSFYQSNSLVKSKDHTNESRNPETETKPLEHENNQRNHTVESNFTRGTSRSETCNCPSYTSCNRAFKHTTQSYSYSNSSEDESERIERKEKELYERRL